MPCLEWSSEEVKREQGIGYHWPYDILGWPVMYICRGGAMGWTPLPTHLLQHCNPALLVLPFLGSGPRGADDLWFHTGRFSPVYQTIFSGLSDLKSSLTDRVSQNFWLPTSKIFLAVPSYLKRVWFSHQKPLLTISKKGNQNKITNCTKYVLSDIQTNNE